MPLRLSSWFFLAAIALLCVAAPARADEDDDLDRFTARLGLVDLQMAHLERWLNKGLAAPKQQEIAQRLADLYASQLLAAAADQERYNDLLARVKLLLAKIPAANTQSLQVILLQADFQRVEPLVGKWLADPAETAARDEARSLLDAVAPKLLSLEKLLAADVDRVIESLDKLPESQRIAQEPVLQQKQVVSARGTYVAGWAAYYWGLVRSESGANATNLSEARRCFRRFLTIDEKDEYSKLSAESLGLDSEYRARAAMGLALAELALGNEAGSRAAFQWLSDASVSPALRDQGATFELQALIQAGRWEEVQKQASERIRKFSGDATPGQVALGVLLVRGGLGRGDSSPAARAVGMLGLEALIRLRQLGIVRQLIDKYKIDVASQTGFLYRWLDAQQLYAAAEVSKKPEDYIKAGEAIEKALGAADTAQAGPLAGDARYFLGWCYFRQKQWANAGQQFQQAAALRKGVDAKGGGEAAWMAFASYQELAASDKRFADRAIEMLEGIKRDFPTSSYAEKVDYQIERLKTKASTPEETMARLEAIPRDDPQYLSARLDIARLRHQLWAGASGAAKSAAAAVARTAVDQYLAAAVASSQAVDRLRALLWSIEVALSGDEAEIKRGKGLIAQALALAEEIGAASPLAHEAHYRALQVAQSEKDAARVLTESRWLGDHARGSNWELSALVVLAQAADAAVESAPAAERPARQQEGFQVYSRLVQVYGGTPAQIKAKKNALVANSKLAAYAEVLGRWEIAAERLTAITTAYPTDQAYLRRGAIALVALGKHGEALEHCRTLLAGLESGSPAWHEAKYYQILCLQKIAPARAREVMSQYRLLHGNSTPAEWRDKMKGLERTLGP